MAIVDASPFNGMYFQLTVNLTQGIFRNMNPLPLISKR